MKTHMDYGPSVEIVLCGLDRDIVEAKSTDEADVTCLHCRRQLRIGAEEEKRAYESRYVLKPAVAVSGRGRGRNALVKGAVIEREGEPFITLGRTSRNSRGERKARMPLDAFNKLVARIVKAMNEGHV